MRGRVAGGCAGGLRAGCGGAAGRPGGWWWCEWWWWGGGASRSRERRCGSAASPRAAVFARREGVGGVDKEPCVERGGGP